MSARPPTSTRTRTPLPCPTLFRCSCDPTNIEAYARAMALPGRTRGGMEWYRALAADHAAALAYKKQPLEMPVLGLGGDQRFGAQMVPMLKEFATNVTGGARPAGCAPRQPAIPGHGGRSEEHTSELQSLMSISYAVFCLNKKKQKHTS